MATLVKFSPFLLCTATAIVDPSMQHAWSTEGDYTLQQALAAKSHFEDRPSQRLGEQELVANDEYEALPLDASRHVTARIVKLEKLVPMVFDFDND